MLKARLGVEGYRDMKKAAGRKGGQARIAKANKTAAKMVAKLDLPKDIDSCRKFLNLNHTQQMRRIGKEWKKMFDKKTWLGTRRRRDVIRECYEERVREALQKMLKKKKLTNYFI